MRGASKGAKPATVTELSPPPRTLLARLGRELRRHRFAYGVVAAFVIAGPFAVWMIFPEASPLLGIVGGLVFGVYAALCAVPDKFMES